MGSSIDMAGWENAYIRVVGRQRVSNAVGHGQRSVWIVECKKCGATRPAAGYHLRSGAIKHCPDRCNAPGSGKVGRPRHTSYLKFESANLRVVGIYQTGKNRGRWKATCKHCKKTFPVRSEQLKANPLHKHQCTRLKDMSGFENEFIKVLRKKRKRKRTSKNPKGLLVYVALCKKCGEEYDVEGKALRGRPQLSHGQCKVVVDLSTFENEHIRVVGRARSKRRASGTSQRRWIVECKKCLRRRPVPTGALTSGNTSGCPCDIGERVAASKRIDYSSFENSYIRVIREVEPVNFINGYPRRRFRVLCKACNRPFDCDAVRFERKTAPVTSCGCMTAELLSRQNQLVPRKRWSGSIFPYRDQEKCIQMRSTWEVAFAWACNFYGIQWVYEPEWFVLRKGVRFLPDFMLTESGRYVEIKGRMSLRDYEQVKLFAKTHRLVFVGRNEVLALAGCSSAKEFKNLFDCQSARITGQ